jgi:hypothetical protein
VKLCETLRIKKGKADPKLDLITVGAGPDKYVIVSNIIISVKRELLVAERVRLTRRSRGSKLDEADSQLKGKASEADAPTEPSVQNGALSREQDRQVTSQEEYQEKVNKDLQEVESVLSEKGGGYRSLGIESWQTATGIVQKVRPVPWLLWNIIHAVYGRSSEIGEPDPMSFSIVSNLIVYAVTDKTLARQQQKASGEVKLLSKAVEMMGTDVAAALCFIHAVCRRVSTVLAERVWRPILDDALLRAHLGYRVGEGSELFGPGRGMLAGFSGRSGLAVQVASGDSAAASKALSGMASGVEMGEVCRRVYGCDPLQGGDRGLFGGGAAGVLFFGFPHTISRNMRLSREVSSIGGLRPLKLSKTCGWANKVRLRSRVGVSLVTTRQRKRR